MTALATVGSATSTSLMSRAMSITTDLPTPIATERAPTSLAVIWTDCDGALIGASPATPACRDTNHDTAIRPARAAVRIDVLVAMVRSLGPFNGKATGYSRHNARYSSGRGGRRRLHRPPGSAIASRRG